MIAKQTVVGTTPVFVTEEHARNSKWETGRVTPDVVIYRYLQIVASTECDTDLLCLLLSTDADLLTQWLKLFNAPADLENLQRQLNELTPAEIGVLTRAQAWSIVPTAGSARLNVDQWLAVLRAACLAEVLEERLVGEQHFSTQRFDISSNTSSDILRNSNIRLRTLLAISGVKLSQDELLSRLIEFRGSSPEMLEDAVIELRIFAVVDAMERGREVELARLLLNLEAEEFISLSDEANSRASVLTKMLDIDTSGQGDWPRRILLQQQISIATASLKGAQTLTALKDAHEIASRSLFATVPLILYQSDEEQSDEVQSGKNTPLQLLGSVEYAIRAHSRTSSMSAVVRENRAMMVSESQDLAVVDRLLLRLLKVESALALPIGNPSHGLLLVAADDNTDNRIAASMYAEILSEHLHRIQKQVPDSTGEIRLEKYKTNEYNRLREIVHEANNPLSIVHNYLHILELRLQHEPEAVEQLQLVAAELRRAGEIFTRARDIPSETEDELPVAGEITELDANTWTVRLAEIISGSAVAAGVELRKDLPDQSIVFSTQADKLSQILSNLLKNAIEACEVADEVVLGVRTNVYRQGRLGLEFFVQDTGPGLPTEVLANLAGQKKSHKGNDHQGIGLQVAFKLAAELDGALDVQTELNRGTTFRLFLPQV